MDPHGTLGVPVRPEFSTRSSAVEFTPERAYALPQGRIDVRLDISGSNTCWMTQARSRRSRPRDSSRIPLATVIKMGARDSDEAGRRSDEIKYATQSSPSHEPDHGNQSGRQVGLCARLTGAISVSSRILRIPPQWMRISRFPSP